MKSDYSIAELVPHAGRMSLLDTVVGYGEDWLQAEVAINAKSLFAQSKGVPAWVGLEYMAQTIAAYAGLQERINGGVPKIGFLLGSRNYACSVDYFPLGQNLSIKVEQEMIADNGLNVFSCELEGAEVHAQAVVNVFQPDDAEKFLEEAVS